jgi:alanine-glyoxylate transaminase/serine-glyoxylate transaminase/serine-pyruvate transaminase
MSSDQKATPLPAVDNSARNLSIGALDVPARLLCGPGPCNAHPRVLQSMTTPLLGHLDPAFLTVMSQTQELMRYAFQTKNNVTLPVSGTGSASMECAIANVVEQKDVVLVAVNGYFGNRMVDMAGRYGGDVKTIRKPWGEVFSLTELETAIVANRPAVLMIVHAETSTGALQPLTGLSEVCRRHNCLLLVDCVTSISGAPLFIDEWGIDIAYAGAQKCLACPPGVSPLTVGERAMAKIMARRSPVANWYLDLTIVAKYWGSERTYHHTAPISMNFAMREALRIVAEEGLEARWARHQRNATLLYDGLATLGIRCHVDPRYRLPSLTTVVVPDGVNAKAVTAHMLNYFCIEIGNGLGELLGRVWRVGLMGYNSRPDVVALLLTTLQQSIQAVTTVSPTRALHAPTTVASTAAATAPAANATSRM